MICLKVLATFIVTLCGLIISANGACITQWGMPGECINVRQCSSVLRILKSRPPMKFYDDLRKLHCGFEGDDPKVCCELVNPTPNPPSEFEMVFRNRIDLPAISKTKKQKVSKASSIPLDKHPGIKQLDDNLCGPVLATVKIFGGKTAERFEFPWMALLAYDFDDDGDKEYRCGGTIINKHYVMTAAHCVTYLPGPLRLVSVRVGVHDVSREKDCEIYDGGQEHNCQDYEIREVHVHPRYSRGTLHNDIALVKINGEFNFKPHNVKPVCLPLGNSSVLTAKSVIATGWGSTEKSAKSDVLLKVSLPVVPYEECTEAFKDEPIIHIIRDQICAGGIKGEDSCVGDSGGPIQVPVFHNQRPKFIQYGIVSFGKKNCGTERAPGVYTNVSSYLRWILDTIST